MDHDPQGSSMRWLRQRPGDLPAIHGIAAYEKKLGVTRAFPFLILTFGRKHWV